MVESIDKYVYNYNQLLEIDKFIAANPTIEFGNKNHISQTIDSDL